VAHFKAARLPAREFFEAPVLAAAAQAGAGSPGAGERFGLPEVLGVKPGRERETSALMSLGKTKERAALRSTRVRRGPKAKAPTVKARGFSVRQQGDSPLLPGGWMGFWNLYGRVAQAF
jgi:hypothetical protein